MKTTSPSNLTLISTMTVKVSIPFWPALSMLIRYLGHVWIHELLHIDWVSQANGYGSNSHVSDLKITLNTDKGYKDYKAYGGRFAKILARWAVNTGSYVIRNADSLALHALALYVQGQLNNQYPLYPLVNNEPETAPHSFILSSNGSVALNTSDPDVEAWSLPDSTCDDDENSPASASPIIIDSFAPSSAYPAGCYSSVSSLISAETPPPTGDPTPLKQSLPRQTLLVALPGKPCFSEWSSYASFLELITVFP